MIPNYHYVLNDNHYFTDSRGCVESFYGNPIDQKAPRDYSAQRNLQDKQPGEDAGHLIAARHNGAGVEPNLVRQDRAVNQRDIAAIERETDELLQEGKNVTLSGNIVYIVDTTQPAAFMQTRETVDQNGMQDVLAYLENQKQRVVSNGPSESL